MKIKSLNHQLLVALMLLISAACANDPSVSTNSAAEKSDPAPASSAKTDTQHPQNGTATTNPVNTQPTDNTTKPDVQATGTSTTTTSLSGTGAKKNYKVLYFNGEPQYDNTVVSEGKLIEDLLKVSFVKTTDMFVVIEEGNNSGFMIHPLPFERDPNLAKPCKAVNCKLAMTPTPVLSSIMMHKLPDTLFNKLNPPNGTTRPFDTKILFPDGRIKMYEYKKRPGASLVTPVNKSGTSVNLSETKQLNTTETATFKKTPTIQVTPAETQQVPLMQQAPIQKRFARPNGG